MYYLFYVLVGIQTTVTFDHHSTMVLRAHKEEDRQEKSEKARCTVKVPTAGSGSETVSVLNLANVMGNA